MADSSRRLNATAPTTLRRVEPFFGTMAVDAFTTSALLIPGAAIGIGGGARGLVHAGYTHGQRLAAGALAESGTFACLVTNCIPGLARHAK